MAHPHKSSSVWGQAREQFEARREELTDHKGSNDTWSQLGHANANRTAKVHANASYASTWSTLHSTRDDGTRKRPSPMKKRTGRQKRTRETGSNVASKRRKGTRAAGVEGEGTSSETRPDASDLIPPLPFSGRSGVALEDSDVMVNEFDAFEDVDAMKEGLEDADFESYVSHFQSGNVGFIPIGTFLYVVQGWSKRKREPINRWYHFQARRVRDNVDITCLCPEAIRDRVCVHSEAYQEFREERFRDFESLIFRDGRVVWFWREMDTNDDKDGAIWLNRFSVATGTEGTGVNDRAMVSYLGADLGGGIWRCSKCSKACAHVTAAHNFFAKVQGRDEVEAADGEIEAAEDDEVMMVGEFDGGRQYENAISFRAVMPPQWASLPSDLQHYRRPDSTKEIPALIPLEVLINRSHCGREMTNISQMQKVTKDCVVYTTTGSLSRSIELVQCPVCPYRKRCFIGPDPRELGLFNFNNSVLFTHELLDEYTSRFTTSETPFAAFVEVVGRVYSGRGSTFVKEDLFRSAWFAYANLQDFSNDLKCERCGDEPECLIWDGVTLGFGRKHLTNSLKPPTHVDSRESIRRYPKKPQAIPEQPKQPLRRLLLRWMRGSTKKPRKVQSEEEDDQGDDVRLKDFEIALGRLAFVSEDLAYMFRRTFGVTAKLDLKLKKRYQNFFEQLAADESALQMISVGSLKALADFVMTPSWTTASALIDIPALYHLLEAEERTHGCYPQDLIKVCSWMYLRVTAVAKDVGVNVHGMPSTVENQAVEEEDWRQTGCCYSLPQIRIRPQYTLRGDGCPETTVDTDRGGKCSKYYSTYGQKRLTGGIMAAWCTHSICYGFHCIPKGEGRNDVFSAMLTRWSKAPRRVVYDFACALAPYCMTREADFFKDTRFLIDKFHSTGHTKCGAACFLSTYTATDPSLGALNSSAAECGNSGIGRIRKSVSYMRQNRAILYTKVFLSVWNRAQIRRMMGY
ncbi:hypothetical protein V5O48_008472 [Marasmius crinis-equi]|uniref:HMG domain-containing protein n=1 Tax=Marasmius crinis-equi TaxID=585013 RepID=A0ABR3FDU4_9AGAR